MRHDQEEKPIKSPKVRYPHSIDTRSKKKNSISGRFNMDELRTTPMVTGSPSSRGHHSKKKHKTSRKRGPSRSRDDHGRSSDPNSISRDLTSSRRSLLKSTTTDSSSRIQISDSILGPNMQMLKPYYLSFHEGDIESEYMQHAFRNNAKRRRQTIIGLNVLLTIYFLYLVVDDVFFPYNPWKVPMIAIDAGLWGITVAIPMIGFFLLSRHQPNTQLVSSLDTYLGLFIVIASILGMSIRYIIADLFFYTPAIRSPEALFLLNVFMIISFYAFRVRFVHTCICVVIIVIVQFGITSVRFGLSSDTGQRADFSLIAGTVMTLLSGTFTARLAFETEQDSRTQFFLSKEMKKATTKLSNQLKMLSRSFTKSAGTFDSPLERTVLIVRSVMADPSLSSQHLMSLGQVLSLLNSTNLLTPDLEAYLGDDIDNEQQAWIISEFASHMKTKRPNSTTLETPTAPAAESTIERSDSQRKPSMISEEAPETSYPPVIPEIADQLALIHNYNFPIFDFTEATKNHPLLVASQHFFVNSKLFQAFSIPAEKFRNFIMTIESGYHKDLPYHNAIHATDVLHVAAYLVSQSNLKRFVSDIELLSIYLAAIIHDHDHPGVTNNFLINTLDNKAILYNDRSVLENHHLATSFQVLHQSDKNFLAHLPKSDLKAIRENVIELVLATDLTQHFSLLSLFKTKVSSTEHYDPSALREDRMLVYKVIMKCSDVSNPTKELPQYEKWCNLILAEFLMQGDMEKKMQLPVSPYMDRDNMNVPSMQLGFIDYVVLPIYEAFDKFQPIPAIIDRLHRNREHWANLKARNVTTVTAPRESETIVQNEQSSNQRETKEKDLKMKQKSAASPGSAGSPSSNSRRESKESDSRNSATSPHSKAKSKGRVRVGSLQKLEESEDELQET